MNIGSDFQFSFSSVVLTIAVIQGIFLSAVLILRRDKRNLAQLLLGLSIFEYSLVLIEDILYQTGRLLRWPYFLNTFGLLIFAVAPTFYLYIRALTRTDFRFKATYLLHYLPFVLFVLISIPAYLAGREYLLDEVRKMYQADEYYFNPTVIIPLLQISIYMILSLGLVFKHSRVIKQFYSSMENISLNWVSRLIGIFVFMWLGWLVCYAVRWNWGLNALDLVYALSVYAFGYFGFNQKQVGAPDMRSRPTKEDSNQKPSAKYARSGLSQEHKKQLADRLNQFMIEQKLYLEPNLTLQTLASGMDVSANHISQVINEVFCQNFYEFINSHRITEFKRLLDEDSSGDRTILELAFESGFNSKSSFNSAFKRVTGMTPLQYRKSQS